MQSMLINTFVEFVNRMRSNPAEWCYTPGLLAELTALHLAGIIRRRYATGGGIEWQWIAEPAREWVVSTSKFEPEGPDIEEVYGPLTLKEANTLKDQLMHEGGAYDVVNVQKLQSP